jgi:hypothetical protein
MGRKLKVFLKALETMEERRRMYPLVDIDETYVPHTQKDLVDSQAQTDPGLMPKVEASSTASASGRRSQRAGGVVADAVEEDTTRDVNAHRTSPKEADGDDLRQRSESVGSPDSNAIIRIRGSASEIPLLFVGEEEEAGIAFGVVPEGEVSGTVGSTPQSHTPQPPPPPTQPLTPAAGNESATEGISPFQAAPKGKEKEKEDAEVQMVVIRDPETAESLFGVVPIPDLVDFIL